MDLWKEWTQDVATKLKLPLVQLTSFPMMYVTIKLLMEERIEAKIPQWRWQQMMIFMLANAISCIFTSIALNIVDKRQDGTLNRSTKHSSTTEPADAAPLLREEEEEGAVLPIN